ncbi:hypothetical protein GGTG_04875 [Gaeumannomyces tritici R3-111a-1]|uniref:Uncharacterized protein n=1 Tax=Gaeumannomyces tritici (strain R3-111a-1) TaxID=644352 RepID=J3NUC1_GAET3|nr:hypothetical protein GGTG_04875 [Gaeumannomyces tritici R3-111a-1]EJT79792.1 hypothetical protein GGTG_04875 [Gaeumannomyces tritici R3-111a-1]
MCPRAGIAPRLNLSPVIPRVFSSAVDRDAAAVPCRDWLVARDYYIVSEASGGFGCQDSWSGVGSGQQPRHPGGRRHICRYCPQGPCSNRAAVWTRWPASLFRKKLSKMAAAKRGCLAAGHMQEQPTPTAPHAEPVLPHFLPRR